MPYLIQQLAVVTSAFGNRSLNQMTTGCFNVSIGGCAGQYMTNGCRNVFLGDQAACCFISGNNNIAIGCRICAISYR